jgi:hypothetical protein
LFTNVIIKMKSNQRGLPQILESNSNLLQGKAQSYPS